MAGLSADTPHPTGITVHTQSRVLEIAFADGKQHHVEIARRNGEQFA